MKKIMISLLVLAMALSLCACGGTQDAGNVQAPEPAPTAAPTEPATIAPETVPEPTEPPMAEATPVAIGESITNDLFQWDFTSIEIVPEMKYATSDYSSTSLFVEEGCQLLVINGHMSNIGANAVESYKFNISFLVNDTYTYEAELHFKSSNSFSLDPLADKDVILYANIPNKLVDMFESVSATIAFNADMSPVVTVYTPDGDSYIEADTRYVITGGLG